MTSPVFLWMYVIDDSCMFSSVSVSLERKWVLRIFVAENVRSGVAVEAGRFCV